MPKLMQTSGCGACSILLALERVGWQVGRTYTARGLTYRTFRRGSERCSLLTLGRSFSTWTSLKPRQELLRILRDVKVLLSYSSLEEIFIKRIHSASSASMMKSTVLQLSELSTVRTTVRDLIALSKLRQQTESDSLTKKS